MQVFARSGSELISLTSGTITLFFGDSKVDSDTKLSSYDFWENRWLKWNEIVYLFEHVWACVPALKNQDYYNQNTF